MRQQRTILLPLPVGACMLLCLPACAADLTATNMPGVYEVAPPPASLNLLRATGAELAAYAVPPRPDAV